MTALGSAITEVDYFACHCYWCPPDVPPTDTWHALRYRMNVQYLVEAGFPRPQVVITESGIDGGVIGQTGMGYRSYGISESAYLAQIEQFDAELRKDSYVVGATIYGANPNPLWETFRLSDGMQQQIIDSAQEVTPVTEPELKPFAIDGRQLNAETFIQHAESLGLQGKYHRVFIHHTAEPDEATWDKWGGWSYWKNSLLNYYTYTRKWNAGPHCFVDQNGIGLFTPLTQDGIGVADNNWHTRHIEIVGNFTNHLPEGARLANAVTCAAELLRAGGLSTNALSYHREYQTDTSCPGDKLVALWAGFVILVKARLAELSGPSQADIEATLGAEMQKHIIPLNPAAALEKAAAKQGLLPAGSEFDLTVGGVQYRCQAFRRADERDTQYGLYAVMGDWGNVKTFKHAN